MSDISCPLCGREMTAIETYAGRGELYCGHCDLTIGGNEAKTPDELMALLKQRTCTVESSHGYTDALVSTRFVHELSCHTLDEWPNREPPSYCPYCGRRIEVSE